MARWISSGSGGDWPSATGRSAIRCKLNVYIANVSKILRTWSIRQLTTSVRTYFSGNTARASAVGTTNSGMIAIALISFVQENSMWCPMPTGGSGGFSPVSTPPAGDGKTSLSGISILEASSAFKGIKYVPTKPPKRAAPTLSGCLSARSVLARFCDYPRVSWEHSYQS